MGAAVASPVGAGDVGMGDARMWGEAREDEGEGASAASGWASAGMGEVCAGERSGEEGISGPPISFVSWGSCALSRRGAGMVTAVWGRTAASSVTTMLGSAKTGSVGWV